MSVVALVAARDRRGLIGRDNALPWHLPGDLRRFRELTRGKPVIMGRRTFEAIGRALPDRVNIVLTRDLSFHAPGVIVAGSVPEALAMAHDAPEVMIAGGSEVFAQFLPRADRLYLTEIDAEFQGDTYFPPFERGEWREIERSEHAADDREPVAYTFVTLERLRALG